VTEEDRGGVTTVEDRPTTPPEARPIGGLRLRIGIALGLVLAVIAVVAVTLWGGPGAPAVPTPGPLATAPALTPPSVVAAVPTTSSAPLRVRVTSIGADSSLVPVGLDAQNRVDVPPVSQPMQAAWYSRSPTPGAIGPSVVLGHVNGDGRRGVFADLEDVRPGQQVEIDRADGRTAVFTVYRVATEPKNAFPTAEVYGNTPDAQLRLVTCGGDLDETRHSYLSNVIVYATLTATRAT
jgi:hypothetical protein